MDQAEVEGAELIFLQPPNSQGLQEEVSAEGISAPEPANPSPFNGAIPGKEDGRGLMLSPLAEEGVELRDRSAHRQSLIDEAVVTHVERQLAPLSNGQEAILALATPTRANGKEKSLDISTVPGQHPTQRSIEISNPDPDGGAEADIMAQVAGHFSNQGAAGNNNPAPSAGRQTMLDQGRKHRLNSIETWFADITRIGESAQPESVLCISPTRASRRDGDVTRNLSKDESLFQVNDRVHFANGLVAHYKTIPAVQCFDDDDDQKDIATSMYETATLDWGLKRPNLIISVTGGSSTFMMDPVKKDKLLQGLMSVTTSSEEADVWFVSDGSRLGIMKFLGEARAKYAPQVPLIGILPWGPLSARGFLEHPEQARQLGTSYEEALEKETREAKSATQQPLQLDDNHTHFFLVDDGQPNSFGGEIPSRTMFESYTAVPWDVDTTAWGQETVPRVCICIQGGSIAAKTVLQAAKATTSYNTETPVLLVKGTGKVADLVADAVILRTDDNHPLYVHESAYSKEQQEFQGFVNQVYTEYRHVIPEKKIGKMTGTLGLQDRKYSYCVNLGKHFSPVSDGKGDEADFFRPEDSTLRFWNGLFRVLSVYGLSSEGFKEASPKAAKAFKKSDCRTAAELFSIALAAAQTNMCWVHNLNDIHHGASEFGDSLIECLINGFKFAKHFLGRKSSSTLTPHNFKELQQEVKRKFFQEMALTISWDKLAILQRTIKEAAHPQNLSIESSEYSSAINKALEHALRLNRVEHVKFLLDAGADIVYPIEHIHGWLVMACPSYLKVLLDWQVFRRNWKTWQATVSDSKQNYVKDKENYVKSRIEHVFKTFKLKGFTGSPYETNNEKDDDSSARGPLKSVKLRTRGSQIWQSGTASFRGANHYLDLMLLNGLMNRPKMAEMLFERTSQPVQSALLLSILSRKLSKCSKVELVIRAQLRTTAQAFERKAIEIMSYALDKNMDLAMDALERPISSLTEGLFLRDKD